ncbi:PREDICTED: pancreatic triacylglycerol lipase-like [Nanorana parkeri]|uniref:pancreatic triacylglycerol lipase-like n=1 Tax=Nanorana parkeri TaxID=125878 RepID=UPI000854559B|nr:PREDICTED: pancreatic triacylglycerol lipase-like [Nanorana parkeri]
MLLSELLTMLITCCLSMNTIQGDEICYNHLGCFYNTKSGKIRPLPWSPEKINTRFLLHTRDNPEMYQEIFSGNMTSVRRSAFRIRQKTVFIVHGLADTAEDNWVSQMIREILRVEDVNCVGVDWRDGAAHLHLYAQASSNIQVVGGEIAFLVTRLQEELDYPPSHVHLIGHSLGAHAAGEAGKRCRGIDTEKSLHLDSSDAELVDIIHTDADPVFGEILYSPRF